MSQGLTKIPPSEVTEGTITLLSKICRLSISNKVIAKIGQYKGMCTSKRAFIICIVSCEKMTQRLNAASVPCVAFLTHQQNKKTHTPVCADLNSTFEK